MIKDIRQRAILRTLREKKIVTVAELSQQLKCSSMTIRRDLEFLEKNNIVRRIHGGAVLIERETTLPAFDERMGRCQNEKIAIGKEAVKLIQNDSVICIDAGTTSLALVNYIPNNIRVTAITTGVSTAVSLCDHKQLEVIQVGGSIHKDSYTVSDSLASNFISQLNADITFLSTRAIDVSYGTFESLPRLAEEKKALISISKKVVILADYTKFNGTSLCKSVPLEKIDVIITDYNTSPITIKHLKKAGIEVIVAGSAKGV